MGDSIYKCIPCDQCRDCQRFGGRAYGYSRDNVFACKMLFDAVGEDWDPDTQGTYPYPGKCTHFKAKDSNSAQQERQSNNTPTELTKGDKFILKLISFLISGCGYIFFVWALIGSLTGSSFSEKWIWIAGTLVISIIIGILKVKTKRLGMILYIFGFLLIVAGIILIKVFANA